MTYVCVCICGVPVLLQMSACLVSGYSYRTIKCTPQLQRNRVTQNNEKYCLKNCPSGYNSCKYSLILEGWTVYWKDTSYRSWFCVQNQTVLSVYLIIQFKDYHKRKKQTNNSNKKPSRGLGFIPQYSRGSSQASVIPISTRCDTLLWITWAPTHLRCTDAQAKHSDTQSNFKKLKWICVVQEFLLNITGCISVKT